MIHRKIALLKADLLGPSDSQLERLLIYRIAASWLEVNVAEVAFACVALRVEFDWGEFLQRRIDRAHRRFLSAARTLVLVFWMGLPSLQISVASQQVNLSTGSDLGRLDDGAASVWAGGGSAHGNAGVFPVSAHPQSIEFYRGDQGMRRLVFIDDDPEELESMREIVREEYDYIPLQWPSQKPTGERIGAPPDIFVSDLYLPGPDSSGEEIQPRGVTWLT